MQCIYLIEKGFLSVCGNKARDIGQMLITQDGDNERDTLTLILILLFKHGVLQTDRTKSR